MSVRDIQIRKTLDEVTRSILQAGDPPQATRIMSEVARRFAERAAGAPRFWPRLWSKRKPIPIDGYNENIKELASDFATLFDDANEIEERTGAAERVLSEETAALRARINQLASKVQSTLLELKSASTLTTWHSEDFTSALGTDLAASTAVIDTEFGRLGMPLTSPEGALVAPERAEVRATAPSGRLILNSPLEWIFSPNPDESAEFTVVVTGPRAEIHLEVSLDTDTHLSRLRLDAVSGTSYGLRIETESDQELHPLYDGIVSHPLEIPVHRKIRRLNFTFALLEPFEQKETESLFRLIVHQLRLFEEHVAGEAVWQSLPIDTPANALWGKVSWQAHQPPGSRVDGVVEIRDKTQRVLSSFPISSGQVFPIRDVLDVTKDGEILFSRYPESSTLPLWQTQKLFHPGVEPIHPKLWFGKDQWKQRVFWREEFDSLSSRHTPSPSDWSEFRSLVVDVPTEYSFYVDQGATVPFGALPSERNVLIALSCHVKVPSPRQIVIPELRAEGLELTLYVNGRQVPLDTQESQAVAIGLNEGWNAIQFYGRTTSEDPQLTLGEIEWGDDAFVVAERESAIWVDPYTLRKSSPARPRNWAAIDGERILIGFNPHYSSDPRTHLKCYFTYTLPQSNDERFIVIGLRLSKEANTPGGGPTVSRVTFCASGSKGGLR